MPIPFAKFPNLQIITFFVIFVAATEPIDATLIAACPDLKAVCSMAVGYNNIDVAACAARGITVAGSNASTVQVASGLNPGDVVVTAGAQALRPGQKVRPLETPQS